MRRQGVRQLCGLFSLTLAVAAAAAPPAVTRAGGKIVVTNGFYTATVAEHTGVLERLATPAFGDATVVNGGFTYSDIGLLAAGSHPYLGTGSVPGTTVAVRTEGETVSVSAEGSLGLRDGTRPPGPQWRYRFRYTFDATPVVHALAGVQTDTPRPPAPGFFATTLNVSGVNEWFADTERGLRWVDLGPEGGRCYELHATPLNPQRRRLGLLNHDNGAVLLVDNVRSTPEGALEDLIFHNSGTGSVMLFLNWLSGQQQTAFAAGQWYDLTWDVSLTGQLPQ